MIHKSFLLIKEKVLKQRVGRYRSLYLRRTRHYLADASSDPYLRREDKGLSRVRIVVIDG